MKYKMGNREFDLVETIVANNLPDEFSGVYDAGSMVNTLKHSFKALGPNKTSYKTEVDYTFKSLMPRIMPVIMPGFFKKQTYKYMKLFQAIAEGKSGTCESTT